ncbi:MAG: PEP-CTERM sorting domain-containing protein [Polyangiales bacterium]
MDRQQLCASLLAVVILSGCASIPPPEPIVTPPAPEPALSEPEAEPEDPDAAHDEIMVSEEGPVVALAVVRDVRDVPEPSTAIAPSEPSQAAVSDGEWTFVRWIDQQPEVPNRQIMFRGQVQRHFWAVSMRAEEVASTPQDEAESIRTHRMFLGWPESDGCVSISALLVVPAKIAEDGETVLTERYESPVSNEITRGECLDPPPEYVPEPASASLLAVGCGLLAWLANRRDRRV